MYQILMQTLFLILIVCADRRTTYLYAQKRLIESKKVKVVVVGQCKHFGPVSVYMQVVKIHPLCMVFAKLSHLVQIHCTNRITVRVWCIAGIENRFVVIVWIFWKTVLLFILFWPVDDKTGLYRIQKLAYS
jgi:hypothetical protein